MRKRLLSIMLTLMMLAGVAAFTTGCEFYVKHKLDYHVWWIQVYIKSDYEQKFKEEGFTVEDFAWDNIEDIYYNGWKGKSVPYVGEMTVSLKDNGNSRIKKAIEHLNGLDFVYKAIPDYDIYTNDCVVKERRVYCTSSVTVNVKKEYKQEFIDCTLNDEIKMGNVLFIYYGKWEEKDDGNEYGEMIVYLKKASYDRANRAVEYLRTLDFVESADNDITSNCHFKTFEVEIND